MQVFTKSMENTENHAMLPLKNSKIGRLSKCDSCFKFWQLRRDSAALQRRRGDFAANARVVYLPHCCPSIARAKSSSPARVMLHKRLVADTIFCLLSTTRHFRHHCQVTT